MKTEQPIRDRRRASCGLGTRAARPGQAMVEFALILPVFLLMVVGSMELGRVVFLKANIENAVREGTRACRISGASQTATTDRIKAMTGLGNATFTPVCCGNCAYGTDLSATVSLPVQAISQGVFPSLSISLSAAARVRVE